jgi:hypothetical protein
MAKKKSGKKGVREFSYRERQFPFMEVIRKQWVFFSILAAAFALSGILLPYGHLVMWLGFAFAAYAAIANDSIQTIGTFIASNQDKKWWMMWLFTGVIFLGTVTYSFVVFDGDVTYQRLLNSSGESKYPHPIEDVGTGFSYLQIIAPLILLVLTRMRMPVSTTFLLLSSFSATSSGITDILQKSLSGYILAFLLSAIIWAALYQFISKYFSSRKAHFGWTIVQWAISGTLWAVWIMQDAANIAVYLPRQLDVSQFIGFAGFIFLGLGVLFYLRGDRIQKIVNEKTRISDVRAATLTDLIYSLLLIYKLFISTIPMSTTWVFLGVIGGREIAVNFMRNKQGRKHNTKAIKLIGKDMLAALIGLAVSVLLAIGVNPLIRQDVVNFFKSLF